MNLLQGKYTDAIKYALELLGADVNNIDFDSISFEHERDLILAVIEEGIELVNILDVSTLQEALDLISVIQSDVLEFVTYERAHQLVKVLDLVFDSQTLELLQSKYIKPLSIHF